MTKLQLLKNAKNYKSDCKAYYSQYLELQSEGLVQWSLGMAFLTEKGEWEITRLEMTDDYV
jgi:hypothetical protein